MYRIVIKNMYIRNDVQRTSVVVLIGFFNIGSGSITDNSGLAKTCVQVLNSNSQIKCNPEMVVPKRYQVMDLKKSRKELCYAPKYDFKSGIRAMLNQNA